MNMRGSLNSQTTQFKSRQHINTLGSVFTRAATIIRFASGSEDHSAQSSGNSEKDSADRTEREAAKQRRFRKRIANKGVFTTVPVPSGRFSPDTNDNPPFNTPSDPSQPQIIPGLLSVDPETATPEVKALLQLLENVEDKQEKARILQLLEAQYDDQLLAQLQALPVEEQDKIVRTIYSPYNDERHWEQQLLEPLMQDSLREELGPELSEIMDILVGKQQQWQPSNTAKSKQRPGLLKQDRKAYDPSIKWDAGASTPAQMKAQFWKLTPEQRERVPELFAKLEELERAYQKAGLLADQLEQQSAGQARRSHLKLVRRARQKGLAEPEDPFNEDDSFDDVLEEDQEHSTPPVATQQSAEPDTQSSTTQPATAGDRSQGSNPRLKSRQRSNKFEAIRQVLVDRGFLQASPEVIPQPTPITDLQGVTQPNSIQSSSHTSSKQASVDDGVSAAPDGDVSNPTSEGGHQDAPSIFQVAVDAGLTPDMANLVSRLNDVYERYNPSTGSGWEEEVQAQLGSPEMQCLKRCALVLSGIAQVSQDADTLKQSGLNPSELQLQMEAAFNDLQALLQYEEARADYTLDVPTRSALRYVRTQLMTPVEEDGNEKELMLQCDITTTDRLLKIIAACEVWEALHTLADNWGSNDSQYGNLLAKILHDMSRVGKGDVDWWVRQPEDWTVEQQTQVMRARLDRLAAQSRSQPHTGGKLHGAGMSDIEPVVLPDEELIEALATLDTGAIRCIQELEEYKYSEEILMKWSLHPVVGPRLMSGQPLVDPGTVHPWFQELFGQAADMMAEGIDYNIKFQQRGRSEAGPGLKEQAGKARAKQAVQGAQKSKKLSARQLAERVKNRRANRAAKSAEDS